MSGKRASISKASLGRRASRANSEPSIAVEVEHATPDAADSTPGMVANTNVNASASASSAKSAIVRIIEDSTLSRDQTGRFRGGLTAARCL